MIKFILSVIKRSAANIIVNWIHFFHMIFLILIFGCEINIILRGRIINSIRKFEEKNVTNKKKRQQTTNAKCEKIF